MSGKWKLSYTTPEGPEESTADVEMGSDGSLSGSLTSNRGTGNIISGYLSADKFSFTINILIEGNPTDVVFTGTFDGTSLKGSIDAMGYNLEFTGVKPIGRAAAHADFRPGRSNKQGFIGRRGCTVRFCVHDG